MTLFEKLSTATSEEDVKAALMKTEVALPLLKDKSIAVKWGKSASDVTPEALDAVSQFNGSNLTASADGLEWNGRKWSIVNHFIPFTEDEVDAPERFESDFMVRQLAGRTLSAEAQAVLDAGRKIWRTYFVRFGSFDYAIREKLKLNRADVGWYQVRNALKLYAESAEGRPTDFSIFESAYKALGDKLRPKVYEYGFLRQ